MQKDQFARIEINEITYFGLIGINRLPYIKSEVVAHWVGDILSRLDDDNYTVFYESELDVLKSVYFFADSFKLCESEREHLAKIALEKHKKRDAIKRYVKDKMYLGREQRKTLLPPPPHEQLYLITSIKFDESNVYNSEIEVKKTDIKVDRLSNDFVDPGDEFVGIAKNLYVPKELLAKNFKLRMFPEITLANEEYMSGSKRMPAVIDALSSVIESVLEYQNKLRDVYIKDPINYPNAFPETWYFPTGIPKGLPIGEPYAFSSNARLFGAAPCGAHWIWMNENDRKRFQDVFYVCTAFR